MPQAPAFFRVDRKEFYSHVVRGGLCHPGDLCGAGYRFSAQAAADLHGYTIDALLGGRPTSNLADAYKVLECTPGMSDAEIKKVYRQKCIDFHPDKLASKGLPDEFMEYANEQLSKVNDAYDTIKKSRA